MARNNTRFHYLMIAMAVIIVLASSSVNAIYLSPNTYSYLSVNSGVYSASFSSPSCVLTLGYISSSNYNDLGKLSNSIPSTFTVLSKSTYYSNSYSYYSFSASAYFVLFNNGTSSCYVDTFSTKLEVTQVSTYSGYSLTLPYGVTKTFSFYSSNYNLLKVKSSSSYSLSLSYGSTNSLPTTTPYSLYSSKTISAYGSTTIQFYYYTTTYFYLQCNTFGGCPVSLSFDSNSSPSDNSTIIPAIIAPVAFAILVPFIVIISVILRRRRRMLMLAAATSIVATTTTDERTRFIQPPTVSTTAQQPYNPPYIPPQPYNNTNYQSYQPYANQPPYVQPQTTTAQPYQPQPQTQPTYYTPGVGVYPNVPVQQSTNPQSKI